MLLRARDHQQSETNRSTETINHPNFQVSCESEAPLQIPFIKKKYRRRTKAIIPRNAEINTNIGETIESEPFEDIKLKRINRNSSIERLVTGRSDSIDECLILSTKKIVPNKYSQPFAKSIEVHKKPHM